MGRGDLSDAEWELIGTLLPSERGRWARPAGDNRRFLNGMPHVLRVGCPWRDMHEHYGSWPCFGSGRKRGDAANALGRSRGGFTSKVHARCDNQGLPVGFILTGGEASDYAAVDNLMACHYPNPRHCLLTRVMTATDSAKTCSCAVSCLSSRPGRIGNYRFIQTIGATTTAIASSACSAASSISTASRHDTTDAPSTSLVSCISPPP